MVNYVLIGLIAASITILTRTFIVTLVVLVPLVLGVSISLLGILPVLKYLPDLAGIQLLTGYPGIGLLDPIPGGFGDGNVGGSLSQRCGSGVSHAGRQRVVVRADPVGWMSYTRHGVPCTHLSAWG